jgi:hypothetical protein
MDDSSTEQKAEALARRAAERAADLARQDGERATRLAVDRAVKDANVDRDLREHAEHLREINGSQKKMATSLENVEKAMLQQATATEAISKYVKEQGGKRFTRLQSIGIVVMGLITLGVFVLALVTALARV